METRMSSAHKPHVKDAPPTSAKSALFPTNRVRTNCHEPGRWSPAGQESGKVGLRRCSVFSAVPRLQGTVEQARSNQVNSSIQERRSTEGSIEW